LAEDQNPMHRLTEVEMSISDHTTIRDIVADDLMIVQNEHEENASA
jgi:hypothetical protein